MASTASGLLVTFAAMIVPVSTLVILFSLDVTGMIL
jgi:hypothetical protein